MGSQKSLQETRLHPQAKVRLYSVGSCDMSSNIFYELEPNPGRLTEFYEDYLDSYSNDAPPVPLMNAAPGPGDRVGAWARSNANPNYGVARSGSRSAPNSQYSPSNYGGGGGSLRRKVTRRQPRGTSRVISTYEEEEEGYGSGEYDDGPYELSMIRVKVIILLCCKLLRNSCYYL